MRIFLYHHQFQVLLGHDDGIDDDDDGDDDDDDYDYDYDYDYDD